MVAAWRSKRAPGEHHNTKYTREIVQEWRRRMQPPLRMKLKDLAAEVGVSPRYITLKFEEYEI